MRRVAMAIGLHAIAVLACAPQPATEAPSDASAHAPRSRELAEAMRRLDALRSSRLPTELDVVALETRESDELARAAREMSEAAAWIASAAPATLDPAGRVEFRAIADELRDRADRLAADAPGLSIGQRRTRLAEIDATCIRCHTRFRIPGVTGESH